MPVIWKKIDEKTCLGVFVFEVNPKIIEILSKYSELLQEKISSYSNASSDIRDTSVNYSLSRLCLYLSSRDPDFFRDFGTIRLPEKNNEISFPFLDPFLARWAANAVVNFMGRLMELAKGTPVNRDLISSEIDKIETYSKAIIPSYGIEKILQTAWLMNIPFSRTVQKLSCYDLGHSDKRTRVWKQFSEQTSHIGTVIATNKELTSSLLFSSGIPVPRQLVIHTEDQCNQAFLALPKPLVVKPLKTDRGIAVTIGIKKKLDVVAAFSNARKYGPVIVEEQIPGEDFRFLVINSKVIGVTTRKPGILIGDGVNSVKNLFNSYMQQRQQDFFLKNFSNFKLKDVEIIQELKRQGLAIDSVPQTGQKVTFRSNPNVSTGGTHENVTTQVHPDNFALAIDAARIIGLDIAGIDFITTDISKSWREGFGAICEINPTPALSVENGVQAILDIVKKDLGALNIPIIVLLRKLPEPGPWEDYLKNCLQSLEGTRVVNDDEYTVSFADLKAFTSYPNTSLVVFSLAEQTIRRVGFTEASVDHIFFAATEFTETEVRNFDLLPVANHTNIIAVSEGFQISRAMNEILDSIRH